MSRTSYAAALVAFILGGPAVGLAADEVTPDRLLNADSDPGNWLTHHRDYSAHRFSPLKQINKDNVKNLHVAWTLQLGGIEGGGIWSHGGLEGTPLAADGYLYVTDGWGSVTKIDTRGGQAKVIWSMDPKTDHDWAGAVACCGVDNRGVALGRQPGIVPLAGWAADRHRQGDRQDPLAAPGGQSRQGRSGHRRAAGG